MKCYYLTLLVFFVSFFGLSQDIPQNFTLEEATAFALKNNYQAVNAALDVKDAYKQKWETIATGLPQITGDISYQNQLEQPVTQFPSILVPEQFLPDGVVQGPETFVPIIFGESQQLRATATLNQQIFDCLLYTSPSPRDLSTSRMPSSA